MMAEKRRDAWRPTLEQELLVRAAVDEGDGGRAAWERWIATVDVDHLDPGSQRMMPFLYRNLLKLGIEHPEVSRLAGSYRHTWAINQLALRQLGEVIAEFERRGIRTMILKGAAMMVRYYKDSGTRPMADFDVLVPLDQTDDAMAILTEMGWIGSKPLHLLTSNYRAPLHGMGFHHPKNRLGFDLHWHVMHLHLAPEFDAPMWEAAVPTMVGNVATRALCAEHQLVHLFFNGCIHENTLNMRWLPDALVLLKNEPSLDWGRLVAHCQRLEFTRPVNAMLSYLHTEWGVAVPAETLNALTQSPMSYGMRYVYATLNTPKQERSGLQVFWMLYTQYLMSQSQSQSQSQARGFAPLGFMQFLRHRWTLDQGVMHTLRYAYQRTRGVDAEKAKELA